MMPEPAVGLADLLRILHESAGAEQGVDFDGDVLDTTFENLGYDSLAIMETTAKIMQEFGVSIDDDAVFEAHTPRMLLDVVNASGVPQS